MKFEEFSYFNDYEESLYTEDEFENLLFDPNDEADADYWFHIYAHLIYELIDYWIPRIEEIERNPSLRKEGEDEKYSLETNLNIFIEAKIKLNTIITWYKAQNFAPPEPYEPKSPEWKIMTEGYKDRVDELDNLKMKQIKIKFSGHDMPFLLGGMFNPMIKMLKKEERESKKEN